MKKIFAIILCLISIQTFGQTVFPPTGNAKGSNRVAGEFVVDSNLVLPVRNPLFPWNWTPTTRKLGSTWVSKGDSLPYFSNGIIARRPVFFFDTLTHKIVTGSWLTVHLTWDSIANKPTVFPVAPHTHPINQVVGLQDSLTNKYTKAQSDALFVEQTQVAVANGVASLNNAGVVPLSQLPSGLFIYKGTWNVTANTPTLINGTGTVGDVYVVTNGPASHDFGAGSISFVNGDRVSYNGTIWQKWSNSDQVVSVNGLQGVVVLTTDDITQGSTNKYYANALVSTYLSGTNGITENSGVIGNDSLRKPGKGLLQASSDKNVLYIDSLRHMPWDSIMNWVYDQLGSLPAAQNFANADLIATGNRLHDFDGNFLQIVGLSGMQLNLASAAPFSVFENGARSWLTVRAGISTTIGDVAENYNKQRIEVNDTGAFIQAQADSMVLQHTSGEPYMVAKTQDIRIGDFDGNLNESFIWVDDAQRKVLISADSIMLNDKVIISADTNSAASGFQFLVRDGLKRVQRKGTIPYNFVSGLSGSTYIGFTGGQITNLGVQTVNGSIGAITGVLQNGGNSFSGAITAGTNDNFGLNLETNNVTKIAIGTNGATVFTPTLSGSSGTEIGLSLTPTVNQTSTAGYTAFDINATESATGSGVKRIFQARLGNVSRFSIYNTGSTDILPNITWSSGTNYGLKVNPTFAITSTAAWNALDIDVSSTGSTSGVRNLIVAKTNSAIGFSVDYGGVGFFAGRLGVGIGSGVSPLSQVHAIADVGVHAGLFTGSSGSNAVGLGSNTSGGIVQGYQANGALTSNLNIQPIGGRTLVAGATDNGNEALQVAGTGIYSTALKVNTGNQAVGKIWRSNNTNGAGDWSDAYVTSVNGSNGVITGVIQQYGNLFGQNVQIGAADNFSVFTVINGVGVGGFSNQLAGSAFLVGTTVYDGSSAMRLQVAGGIKATAATYSSGGLSYLVRNSTSGNFESVTTIPTNVLRIDRRALADANTTIAATDYLVVLTTNTTAHTFTLPLASTMTGQEVVVKDESGAAGTFNLTVVRSGSNTIDGATSQVINTNYGKFTFYSNGTNWFTK